MEREDHGFADMLVRQEKVFQGQIFPKPMYIRHIIRISAMFIQHLIEGSKKRNEEVKRLPSPHIFF